MKIGEIVKGDNQVTVNYTDNAGAERKAVFDKLIISIGRTPNTNGLNTEAVGLQLDERGFVAVDGDCKPICQTYGRWVTWCVGPKC